MELALRGTDAKTTRMEDVGVMLRGRLHLVEEGGGTCIRLDDKELARIIDRLHLDGEVVHLQILVQDLDEE